jgi:hypothetical protein
VLDAINFEKQGVPAVAVVTEPFIRTAQAVAEMNGIPDYPFVVVPHPFGSLDEAGVHARADAALARIEALLRGPSESRSAAALPGRDERRGHGGHVGARISK